MDVDLKVHLRSCATRLQHAQSKFESDAQVSKRDISTLLRQHAQHRAQASYHHSTNDLLNARIKADEADRTLEIARQKAEKIMSDDRKAQIMNLLERSCDVLAEARVLPNDYQMLSQDLLISVCTIIEGAPRVDAKELHTLRHLLSDIYDPLTSATKRQSHVHPIVVRQLRRPPQHRVDAFLVSIARAYQVEWYPPYPLPAQRLSSLAQLLDPNSSASVDLATLRSLCTMGLPDQPPSLRPRAWGLLLGIIPPDKEKWSSARQRLRTDYIALAGPILASVHNLPRPSLTTNPAQMDKYLVQFSKDIEALPPSIRQELDETDFPEPSPQTETETTTTLQYPGAVSARLDAIRAQPGSGAANSAPLVPSITLEGDPSSPVGLDEAAKASTTLFASNGKPRSSIWEGVLLRLLHTHCVLHASYGIPEGPPGALVAILGVLLCVFSSDIDDAASPDTETAPAQTDRTRSLDAEATTFWAMESLISGLREALEEDTDPTSYERWNHKFSRMLRIVDAPLWEDLRQKSLDPALPYYANRWIPTLFTHTLHMYDVLPIWDAMFILPAFAHDSEKAASPPQVEFLLNVGVTMLTRARVPLLLLNKRAAPAGRGRGHRSLWSEEQFALPASNIQTPAAYSPVGTPRLMLSTSSTTTAWGLVGGLSEGEAGEAFLKGVKILQAYDVEQYGGIERVLQGAWGLYAKRIGRGAMEIPIPGVRVNQSRESQSGTATTHGQQQPQLSRFDRLAEVVWKGLTNEASSPPPSPLPTAPPSPSLVVPKFEITAPSPLSPKPPGLGFGAMIRDTLWKGVTNQVDSDEPSPEPSPVASRSASPLLGTAAAAAAEDDVSKLEQDQKQQSGGGDGGAGGGGGWFGGFGDSDAVAVFAKTSTNLRVRAMDVLGRTSPKPEPKPQPPPQPQPVYETFAPPPSTGGSWTASFASFGFGPRTAPEGGDPHSVVFDARSRHGSLPTTQPPEREIVVSTSKDDLYSPPPRPSFFRPARDSTLPTTSPTLSPSSTVSETSPSPSKSGTGAIQSALAALTGSSVLAPTPVKKSAPKPLLLNSRSLMTAPISPRLPGRSASPAPRPRSSAGGGGHAVRSASSSRNNSIDQVVQGASGVVSLRRGPITSTRIVGGPNNANANAGGRPAFNSRDSISSTGSNRYSDHRFSYEESSAGEQRERDSRSYSLSSSKSKIAGGGVGGGFIVDRGMDSPVTVRNRDSTSTGTSGARTSPPQSLHPEEGGQERERVVLNDLEDGGAESDHDITIPAGVLLRADSDESASGDEDEAEAERAVVAAASPQATFRAKRQRDTSASDLHLEAQREDDLGDRHTTSNLSVGVTIERKGATVNRSRTPRGSRRPYKGTGTGTGTGEEEDTGGLATSRISRKNANSIPSRGSTPALVSGSEEEGARADVEDELYTDLVNP